MSDMSLTSGSDILSQQQEPMPTVELSFSTGANGAWDDRELINAANSAMKEFHTHHPGPGTWLDKATAATALGRPLPGANDYGTAWYTASVPPVNAAEPETPAKKKRKTKQSTAVNPYDSINTYSPSIPALPAEPSDRANRRSVESPRYQPPSPGGMLEVVDEAAADAEWGEVEEVYDEDHWEAEDESPYKSEEQVRPQDYGVYDTTHMSREDALRHAMTAQYWAGYWMGVVQTKSESDRSGRQNQGQSKSVTSFLGKSQGANGGPHEKRRRSTNLYINRQPYSNTNGLSNLKR
ncbi:hypothetical protein L204_104521 [Cryptococcus depauperatus]